MHVHIQNRPNDSFLPLGLEIVQAVDGADAYQFTVSDTGAGFAAAMTTAEILVTTSDQLKLRFPCPAPRLRAVFLKHAGVDTLLVNNPLPPGVILLNNSGAHASRAGEYVLMATLMLRSGMQRFIGQQQEHKWLPHFSGMLAGTRATILGVGGLGAGSARALRPHGVHLTGVRNNAEPHPDFDRTLNTSELDAVLETTDILVLAAPLTSATRGIICAARLKLLPTHAAIINIARGELIDEAALVAALTNGEIAGAVLDVQTNEPLPADDPLWTTPNLVITPHVSSTDVTSYGGETVRILLNNLDDIESGRTPRNLVNLQRGY